jgi:hypothetical protein
MVLLALCDNANDQGECYPSIATIAEKCSMGERTAYRHITDLENNSILSRQNRSGRSTLYTIHPCQFGTPANLAPLPNSTQTPANLAPTPANLAPTPANLAPPVPANLAPITIIEPSSNQIPNTNAHSRSAEIKSKIFKVDDVDETVWQDFVTLRKAKKSPLTKTAMDGIRDQADKAGMTIDAVLRMCCERGWVGFKAEWVAEKRIGSAKQAESFRERDARLGRERWEKMTGQTHPDSIQTKPNNVVDITPKPPVFLEIAR